MLKAVSETHGMRCGNGARNYAKMGGGNGVRNKELRVGFKRVISAFGLHYRLTFFLFSLFLLHSRRGVLCVGFGVH